MSRLKETQSARSARNVEIDIRSLDTVKHDYGDNIVDETPNIAPKFRYILDGILYSYHNIIDH